LERLGAGGMGEVYLAKDTRLGRKVALKVLPPRLAARPVHMDLLRREARAVAALQHPNLVTLYSFEEADDATFLTMEFVEGRTLAEMIPGEGMELLPLLDIAIQIADALAVAHERGIVHRDIKPRNLMVDTNSRVKVLDFGVAKRLPAEDEATRLPGEPETLTQDGHIVGTVSYMSPEQLQGKPLDQRSDIFSLGVVLYQMATGELPYNATTPVDQMVAMLESRPTLPGSVRSRLPRRFDEIVARCLDRDPRQRYQKAAVLREDLKELRQSSLSGTQGWPALRVTLPWGRAYGRAVAACLLILALIGVGTTNLIRLQLAQERTKKSPVVLPLPAMPALAVLPLENLSGEEYFADGMTDALISSLGSIHRARVISRQSVMHYKNSDEPLPAIARDLGVDLVLTGTVFRAGALVKISVQLVRADPEDQLWTHTYYRDIKDILPLQDEVAREVAREVRIELTDQERARLSDGRSVNPDAYDLYAQGRSHCEKRTREELELAAGYFEQAIEVDPGYAAAHAGLAEAYALLGYFRYQPPEDAFTKARGAAMQALSLDRSLAEAHATLGFVRFFYNWDGIGAQSEYRQALALNSSYATVHLWLWGYLSATGQMTEAGEHIASAMLLNPYSASVFAADASYALQQSNFQLAIDRAHKAVELDPQYAPPHQYLWVALHQQGKQAEAFQEYKKTLLLLHYPAIADLAEREYQKSGYRAALVQAARELGKDAPEKAQIALIAETFALTGNRGEALSWIEKGVNRRDAWVLWLQRMIEFKDLRDDSRFRRLVELTSLRSS
jgi:serine/threonine-protein kinase